MYSLDCSYFEKSFSNVDDLVDYVVENGMDPNYEITHNGEGTSEQVIDLIQF
tara:strand:+ start:647 stop:802 length:156 start_codon:yes stop_codon:yes gene_type:complete